MNTPKPLPSLSLIQQAFPDQAKLVELTRLVVDRDSVSHVEIEDALRAVNRRFDKLPLFNAANRINAYGVFLDMEAAALKGRK